MGPNCHSFRHPLRRWGASPCRGWPCAVPRWSAPPCPAPSRRGTGKVGVRSRHIRRRIWASPPLVGNPILILSWFKSVGKLLPLLRPQCFHLQNGFKSGFKLEMILLFKEYSAMSGDISGCRNWGYSWHRIYEDQGCCSTPL